jgi:hypothetical protein
MYMAQDIVDGFGENVTANVLPSSLIFVTVIMEAIRSSETSVLTRATSPYARKQQSS